MSATVAGNWAQQLLYTPGLVSNSEKLTYRATVSVLVSLTVLLATKPFFVNGIACQVPKDWPSSSVNYFHDVCFFGDRTKTSFNKRHTRADGGSFKINEMTGSADYYMWIPLFVAFQLLITLVPTLFWKFIGLSWFHGSDIAPLLEAIETDDPDNLLQLGDYRERRLAVQLIKWISAKKDAILGLSRTMTMYVIMKWIRLFIFVIQFTVIANVFEDGVLLWGVHDVLDIISGVYRNPLKGEFTLVAGCEVQRLQVDVGPTPNPGGSYSRVNSVLTNCVLPTNFLNAKVALLLYWWLLLVILVSFASALNFTVLLFWNGYRRYIFKTIIRNEEYYIEHDGPPNPDLNLGKQEPIDYFVDYFGNDGFLFVYFVFDTLHYHRSSHLCSRVWTHIMKNNGKIIEEKPEEPEKEEEHGQGDRTGAGKEPVGKGKHLTPLSPSETNTNPMYV